MHLITFLLRPQKGKLKYAAVHTCRVAPAFKLAQRSANP